MKKTILAASIASLFATAAHSATIYEEDHLKIDVYGDLEVVYIKSQDENEDAIIDIDDADFGFKLGCNIDEEFSVLAVLEFSAEGTTDDGSSDVVLDDAYVGFQSTKWGTVTVGQQVTIFDDAGIGSDYQFGLNDFYEQDVASTQVLKYTLDTGRFYGGVAYLLNTSEGDDNYDAVDGKLGARFGGFDATVFYGEADLFDDDTNENVELTNLNFELRYSLGDIGLAAAYSTRDRETATSDVTTESYGLAATYQMGKAQFATGWSLSDADDGSDDVNSYYVNASYAYTSSVNMYVEIGGSDEDDTELGYATGMQVTF